jgi:hypothetical protein
MRTFVDPLELVLAEGLLHFTLADACRMGVHEPNESSETTATPIESSEIVRIWPSVNVNEIVSSAVARAVLVAAPTRALGEVVKGASATYTPTVSVLLLPA